MFKSCFCKERVEKKKTEKSDIVHIWVFLLSEIIYSYQVEMGFEIDYFKALNPITLMVKLLLLANPNWC